MSSRCMRVTFLGASRTAASTHLPASADRGSHRRRPGEPRRFHMRYGAARKAVSPSFEIWRSTTSALAARIVAASRGAGPPLLFGLRMWAAVSLALFVAFWLQLDNGYWAGTSAAIVCQPQLGASLRKGWYRMVGTMIGAVVSVVLAACFPQNRLLYLGGMAVWGAACAFAA